MPKSQPLGDVKAPPTPEEHRNMIKLGAAITMARVVIGALIGFTTLWMVFMFFNVPSNELFDRGMKIFPVIVPFWATISGTVLGYLFGKNE